jgi:hypothetical protein
VRAIEKGCDQAMQKLKHGHNITFIKKDKHQKQEHKNSTSEETAHIVGKNPTCVPLKRGATKQRKP